MPAELLSLKEQLKNLYIVYEDALEKNLRTDELDKLRKQMIELQDKIIKREEMLANQK